MFEIGDRVVYPHHGAGIISGVEEKELLGEKKKYYILQLSLGQLKVMVPADNTSELGVRGVISSREARQVLAVLAGSRTRMPKDWNRRFKKNAEKIKTNDVYEVAEVVRNLTLRDLEVGLSTGEKRMLNRARQILVSELIFALDLCEEKTTEKIDAIFARQGGKYCQ